MGSRLHSRTATRAEVISTNGIAFLDEILINATITQTEDDFYAEIVLAVKKDESLKYIYDNLIEEAIITLEDEYGDEFFRISNIRKDKRTITIFARQITIADQLTLFLKDCRPENMNGQATLSKLQNDAIGRNKEFFLTSDISNESTAYYQNMSLYNALFGADNAFIVRWGGEVYRRQYNCKINIRVGQDKGVQIKSRKNLTGFEIKSNVDDLCTRIVPRGFDGIEGSIIESPLINNYSSVYTKVMEFPDIKVRNENNPDEGYETLNLAQRALEDRAREQFNLFNIDKLQATYNINFIELSKTEQYKDYSQTESVEIGDTVEVIEDTYGTKIKARCIKRVYSVTMKKRLSTELSNVKKESRPISVNDIIAELEKELQTKPNANLSDYINSMINAGLKDSYVVLKPNELLIMDNKDIKKAVNVTRYNKNGLGFSTTGYYGKYEYGFTIDGKINASLITFGAMSGQYIQAGTIEADRLTVQAIKEIANKVSGNFVTKAELDVKADEILAKVSQESDAYNLIPNGTFEDGTNGYVPWNAVLTYADGIMLVKAVPTATNFGFQTPVFNLQSGLFYSLSFDVNSRYNTPELNYCYLMNAQYGNIKLESDIQLNPQGNTTRVKLTFKTSDNYRNVRLLIGYEGAINDTTGFRVANLMLAKGEFIREYTPKMASYTETELKLKPNAIIQSVNEGLEQGTKISVASTVLDKNGFSQLNNGKLSVRLNNNGTHVYSFLQDNKINGSLQALKNVVTGDDVVGLTNEKGAYAQIAYRGDGSNYYNYMRFDKEGLTQPTPITVYEEFNMNGLNMFFDKKRQESRIFGYLDSRNRGSVALYTNNFGFWSNDGSGNHLLTLDRDVANFYNKVIIGGDLSVIGNKNCIQQTKFGNVPFYANEDINSLLTETDTDNIYTTELVEGKYICRIEIDEIIQECINTTLSYNVYIDKLSWGDYKVEIREKDYFIVESDREMKFKYKLEGKRKGFEDKNKINNFMNEANIKKPFNTSAPSISLEEQEVLHKKPINEFWELYRCNNCN